MSLFKYLIWHFVALILVLAAGFGYIYFKHQNNPGDIPEVIQSENITKYTDSEKQLYYEMFDKDVILDKNETTAVQVTEKLDLSFNKNRQKFIDLANLEGVSDQMLKALYYLNFVSFTYNYGSPDTEGKAQSIQTLLWEAGSANCQTNTMLLEMLLKTAKYQTKTVSINGLSHGYNEINIGSKWQILDATTNLWINRSTKELLDGKKGEVKKFFLDDSDIENRDFSADTNVSTLRTQMINLGGSFIPTQVKYDYFTLDNWQY